MKKQLLSYQFSQWVIKFRLPIILFNILLSVIFIFSLRTLSLQTNLGDFAPQRHAYLKVQNELTRIFGGLNQVSVAVEVKNGTILNPVTLKKVYDITREIYLTRGVNAGRVVSLSSRKIKHIVATEEGFSSQRLMHDPPKDAAGIAELQQRIVRNPMVYGSLVAKDFKSTLIQADFDSGVPSRTIFKKLQTIISAHQDKNHNVYFAGRPILEGWLDHFLPRMFIIFGLMFLLMAGILYLAFKSKRGIVLPLWSALMATIWGLGIMQFFGYTLGPTTILVPFLVLALGISHSVQFIKRYYEYLAHHQLDSKKSATAVAESLFLPACTSLATDGIGFLSLFFIPLGMIRSMALTAGAGVLSIFFTTVMFIPAVLSYLPPPKRLEVEREERPTLTNKILGKIARRSTKARKRKVVFIGFAVLFVLSIFGARRLVVGDNEPGSSALYPSSRYNRAERFISEKFAGSDSYYILVEGKEADSLIDVKVLKEMEGLQQALLKEVPEAGRGVSLADYIKGMNLVMHAGDFAQFRIPEKDRTIAEYLFLYSITAFPGDFDPVISPDYRYANIKIDMRDHKASTIKKAINVTRNWIKKEHKLKDIEFKYAGGSIGMLGAVNEIIARTLPLNILQVSVLVFLCVSIAYYSLIAGALLLIPLMFSVLFTFGALGLLGISLTVETLPVAALGIGLGVDYGIYVISRLRSELKSGAGLDTAIIRALNTSGKAVFFTAITIIIGVGLWLFSSIKLQARLGAVLATLLFLNMLGALIILPGLLLTFKPKFLTKGGGNEA